MSYITAKVLLTNKNIEFINKIKFTVATMNKDFETFIVHITSLEAELLLLIDLTKRVQILALQVAKTSTKISAKYLKYTNVFFCNLVIELSQNTGIKKYIIEMMDVK